MQFTSKLPLLIQEYVVLAQHACIECKVKAFTMTLQASCTLLQPYIPYHVSISP